MTPEEVLTVLLSDVESGKISPRLAAGSIMMMFSSGVFKVLSATASESMRLAGSMAEPVPGVPLCSTTWKVMFEAA